MLIVAAALADPPVPTLSRGQRLAIAATLDHCTVNVAARARGRRKVTIYQDDPLVVGHGTATWSGPPPDGRGQARDWFDLTAIAGRKVASARMEVTPPIVGPFTVDGAPVAGQVEGWADAPPVVVATVDHPCPELLTFHVSGALGDQVLRPVDGVLRIPLTESFGDVRVEASWSGFVLGDPRTFFARVRAPRPCLDDDSDGLSDCAGDCDDGDPQVRPGHPEVWWDNKDNDCDGARLGNVDGDDWDASGHVPRVDGAGVRALEALYGPIRARRLARELQDPVPGISASLAFDCDDTDRGVGRGTSEPWGAPICAMARPGGGDDDGDGFARECADDDATRHPGAPEIANGFDDDCDGAIDEGMAVPDADDSRLDAPRWLGLLELPAAQSFVLADRDVDAFSLALSPPPERAEHRIEVDTGGGTWHGALYGAPADAAAGGLTFVTSAYGNQGQTALFRVRGGAVISSGGGSVLGLTTKLLRVLPFEAAVPVGALLLPAAVVADVQASAPDGPAPTPALATVPGPPGSAEGFPRASGENQGATPSAVPADAWIYVLVITRDRGPGGLAELRVWEDRW